MLNRKKNRRNIKSFNHKIDLLRFFHFFFSFFRYRKYSIPFQVYKVPNIFHFRILKVNLVKLNQMFNFSDSLKHHVLFAFHHSFIIQKSHR